MRERVAHAQADEAEHAEPLLEGTKLPDIRQPSGCGDAEHDWNGTLDIPSQRGEGQERRTDYYDLERDEVRGMVHHGGDAETDRAPEEEMLLPAAADARECTPGRKQQSEDSDPNLHRHAIPFVEVEDVEGGEQESKSCRVEKPWTHSPSPAAALKPQAKSQPGKYRF